MIKRLPTPRGSALLTSLVLMAILLGVVSSLFVYVNYQRRRATSVSRAQTRSSCAQSGLQYARSYFGRNVNCGGTCVGWGTYLSTPSVYNPVPASWNTTAAALQASIRTSSFQSAHPELFTDLDNDGKPDVYIYVRDNEDEMLPASPNPSRDNDQNVIIGSICISTTLVPHRDDGSIDTDPLVVESLLSFNTPGTFYYAQAGQGAAGDGNTNR